MLETGHDMCHSRQVMFELRVGEGTCLQSG
jgi:hypothetical protein